VINVSHYYHYANLIQNQVAEREGRFILLESSMLAGVFKIIFERIWLHIALILYPSKHFPKHKHTIHSEQSHF
jgi:hypothetical protein